MPDATLPPSPPNRPSVDLDSLTRMQTIDIAAIPTETPSTLATAQSHFLRVAIRNIGPNAIQLSLDPTAFQSANASTILLASGLEEIVPIAPSQSIYAAGVGGGARVNVIRSVAIPLLMGA